MAIDTQAPEITAWMKPSCGWSNGVRAVLAKYALPYEDKDIINVPDNYIEMVMKTGQRFQPSLEINGQVVADVSGEELEQYLIAQGLVKASGAEAGIALDAPCSDEEHAAMAAAAAPKAQGLGLTLGDISS